jgi:hypothetical protein
MSLGTVSDDHVKELYKSGAVVVHNALQYVFSKADEQLAVAAVAARLLDERAVCHVVGPTKSLDCRSPTYTNGMVAISWTSPQSCIHCDTELAPPSDIPSEAVAALDVLPKRGQRFEPGDVLAFLCGPVAPTFISSSVWVHAPASFDASAAFVDEFFTSRVPTVRGDLIDQFANAPFVSDGAHCRTGPVCAHGPTTRCVCD